MKLRLMPMTFPLPDENILAVAPGISIRTGAGRRKGRQVQCSRRSATA
jgi:hypothetical protein